MDNSKLKPFDLERALEGDRVVTRNGREVEQLFFFDKADGDIEPYLLKVVIDKVILDYTRNGKFHINSTENENDLFMAPKKREGWINLYKRNGSNYAVHTSHAFNTKEEAEKEITCLSSMLVATVKIEWEE